MSVTRREALVGASALATALFVGASAALASAGKPPMTIYRDPNCGCCHKWAEIAKAAGYPVRVVESSDMAAVKARLGVPDDLMSCHTAQVGGYIVEGHVPMAAIARLLREKPKGISGIALPGMPAGSPGMEVPGGRKDPLNVIAFNRSGTRKSFGS